MMSQNESIPWGEHKFLQGYLVIFNYPMVCLPGAASGKVSVGFPETVVTLCVPRGDTLALHKPHFRGSRNEQQRLLLNSVKDQVQ